jgi:hypothetical protein
VDKQKHEKSLHVCVETFSFLQLQHPPLPEEGTKQMFLIDRLAPGDLARLV